MNSMTSESGSHKDTKSLIFDVAEAEALMDEFGIVAPLSGFSGSLQVIHFDILQFDQFEVHTIKPYISQLKNV